MSGITHNANFLSTTGLAHAMGSKVTTASTIQITFISDEEKEELKKLQTQRELDTKQEKRLAFKKMEPNIRQLIVDYYKAKKEILKINTIEAKKSDREVILESKNLGHYAGIGSGMMPVTLQDEAFDAFAFQSFPVEDLEMMHCEACAEEHFSD